MNLYLSQRIRFSDVVSYSPRRETIAHSLLFVQSFSSNQQIESISQSLSFSSLALFAPSHISLTQTLLFRNAIYRAHREKIEQAVSFSSTLLNIDPRTKLSESLRFVSTVSFKYVPLSHVSKNILFTDFFYGVLVSDFPPYKNPIFVKED